MLLVYFIVGGSRQLKAGGCVALSAARTGIRVTQVTEEAILFASVRTSGDAPVEQQKIGRDAH